MADLKGITKARMELEELYLGIPDDSVDLTFQDLANVEKRKPTDLETIQESKPSNHASPLNKLPSLDFNRGLQGTKSHHHHHLDHLGHHVHTLESHSDHRLHHNHHIDIEAMHASHGRHHHAMENSRAYDDISVMSTNSMYQGTGRRRAGIPHSNVCAICSTYIYIFRHRCLVCGRVYCRNCVNIGMGDMTEGRKCIQCLGRRFSQRYIERAGNVGWCCFGYPSRVKQAELRWAEKGPRRSGEKQYGQSTMMSRSTTPTRPRVSTHSPSFASSISYSPYSPNHHHLPL